MAALNAAYEVLRDPTRRAQYDNTRRVSAPKEEGPIVSFGRYKGQPIGAVPTSYLLWAYREMEDEGRLFDVTQELIRRGAI